MSMVQMARTVVAFPSGPGFFKPFFRHLFQFKAKVEKQNKPKGGGDKWDYGNFESVYLQILMLELGIKLHQKKHQNLHYRQTFNFFIAPTIVVCVRSLSFVKKTFLYYESKGVHCCASNYT